MRTREHRNEKTVLDEQRVNCYRHKYVYFVDYLFFFFFVLSKMIRRWRSREWFTFVFAW